MSKPRFFMGPAGAATDDRLNMTDLRVLCILGTFTNNKGWCFPLQETLAKLLHRSRPVVNASLKRLETCGYIESKKKPGGANRKLYRVVLDVREDVHDLPEGLFEVEEDVSPADISPEIPPQKAKDVRPADMSVPQTCLPDKHVSAEMSAPRTPDVGPTDTHRELEPTNQKKKERRAPRVNLHSLPEDWDPRDEEVRLAESLNFTKDQFDRTVARFREYWLERAHLKKGQHANWHSTFSKWLDNQARHWNLDRQKPSPWAVPTVNIEPDWPAHLTAWLETGAWKPALGPTPDKAAYRGPLEPLRPLLAGRNLDNPVIAAVAAKLEIGPKQKADLFQ